MFGSLLGGVAKSLANERSTDNEVLGYAQSIKSFLLHLSYAFENWKDLPLKKEKKTQKKRKYLQ